MRTHKLIRSRILSIFIFIFIFFSSTIKAQEVADFADYKVKYNDQIAVYLNLITNITVNLSKNGPIIEKNVFEEKYYNDYRAGLYSDASLISSDFSKLIQKEASTLVPENGKFKEVKVKEFETKSVFDNQSFHSDTYATQFIYPSLREGAISRLNYTMQITLPYFFPFAFLQRELPVENFEFTINIDKDIHLKIETYNLENLDVNYTKIEKGNRVIHSWKIKNLKKYKEENNAPDFLYYVPQIIPYITSYKSGSETKTVFGKPEDLLKWYNENIAKIDHRHTESMESTIKSLTEKCTTEKEKVAAIYQWVQKNIKYIANEYGIEGFVPRDPYQIFEKRFGDCKDMAVLLVELLKVAGIDGYYTWIGSRELPYKFSTLPTAMAANHMIATYISEGKFYFLDATDDLITMDFPSRFTQGKEAFIRTDSNKYIIKEIPIVESQRNFYQDSLLLQIENDQLTGNGQALLKGYYRVVFKENLEDKISVEEKNKIITSWMRKGNNKCVADNFKINDIDGEMRISYNLLISDYIKKLGDEYFVNMNLWTPYKSFELFDEKRTKEYEFRYASEEISRYCLKIPEGYIVQNLPANASFSQDQFGFTITYTVEKNLIIYQLQLYNHKLVLEKSDFELWNSFIKNIRSQFKEVVVLKKKI